jgi:purine-binding chemotaxis protein CheW
MRSQPRVHAPDETSLVSFTVGTVRYAVPIDKVREIVAPLDLTALPNMPDGIAGVCNHRDEVVAVIDLRSVFGLPKTDRPKRIRWVIVDTGGRTVALIADDVAGVVHVGNDDFRGPPDLGGARVRAIANVLTHEERLVFVIDVSQFQAIADRASIRAPEPKP